MIGVRALTPAEIAARLEDLAQLRITVFHDWPYLYQGTLAYERDYLKVYLDSADALVVGAFDGNRLVGAATSSPMRDHAAEFATPLALMGLPIEAIHYGGESILLPAYRGQGIGHRFFDLREAHARDLGASHMAFCSVIRPEDHPLRPVNARSNDAFWRKRGYAPVAGAVAEFQWQDRDQPQETAKPLQFWMRALLA